MPVALAPHDVTRQRLLEAAGRVFAEQGFRQATVREICSRAGANIAAVNYHFRDKDTLYAETLKYGAHIAIGKFPPDMGLGDKPSPQEQLYAFIYSFLSRFLDMGHDDWHGKLCAREMVEPTAALDNLVAEVIVPLSQRLEAIVQQLLGPKPPQSRVRLAAMSIVGQCLLYHHQRPVLERLYGPQSVTAKDIRRLAEHITEFSLGALRHIRKLEEMR